MKVKNKSKKLIVLNYKDKKEGFKTLSLGAGETKEAKALKQSDVDFYVKKGSIEIVKDEKKEDKSKKELDPVVLPENPTVESLGALNGADLARYLKENNITIPKNTKKEGLVELILDSLKPQE